MADRKTELQQELEEVKKEYDELMKEVEELEKDTHTEIGLSMPGINPTMIHIFNISIATVMIFIGAILAYQTRNTRQKSGRKIAGWILLILGALVLLQHSLQLIF